MIEVYIVVLGVLTGVLSRIAYEKIPVTEIRKILAGTLISMFVSYQVIDVTAIESKSLSLIICFGMGLSSDKILKWIMDNIWEKYISKIFPDEKDPK